LSELLGSFGKITFLGYLRGAKAKIPTQKGGEFEGPGARGVAEGSAARDFG